MTNEIESAKNEIRGYINEELLLIGLSFTAPIETIIAKYEKIIDLTEKYDLEKDVYLKYAEFLAIRKRWSESYSIASKYLPYAETQFQKDKANDLIANAEFNIKIETSEVAAQSYIQESLCWIKTATNTVAIQERYEKIVDIAEKYNFDRDFYFGFFDFLVKNNKVDDAVDIAISLHSYYRNKNAEQFERAKKTLDIARSLIL